MAIAPQLGFVAGLALHDAVCQVLRRTDGIALKWPNDLLVAGRKTAGLLLEGHAIRGGSLALVIGMGVNIAAVPPDAPYPTSSLREIAPELDRETLFAALSETWINRFDSWTRFGLAATLADWSARAAGLNEMVGVRLPDGDRRGRFKGLDPAGRMILDTASGPLVIDAGDLFFPRTFESEASGPAPH